MTYAAPAPRTTGTPSTVTSSTAGSTLVPNSVRTSLFTRTRPAVYEEPSEPRRLATPARAEEALQPHGHEPLVIGMTTAWRRGLNPG